MLLHKVNNNTVLVHTVNQCAGSALATLGVRKEGGREGESTDSLKL